MAVHPIRTASQIIYNVYERWDPCTVDGRLAPDLHGRIAPIPCIQAHLKQVPTAIQMPGLSKRIRMPKAQELESIARVLKQSRRSLELRARDSPSDSRFHTSAGK